MENEDEKAFKSISSEIVCVFKTNLAEKYKIEEDQQYTVKTEFNEKNLSELVQHILGEENPEIEEEESKKPESEKLKFEFLINGEFLRGNIKSHLMKHKITAEKSITIYYTFGLNKPKEDKKTKEEDWISNISLLNPYVKDKQSPFVASLFNGDISFYDSNINLLHRQNLSESAIKQTVVSPYISNNKKNINSNQYLILSACQDETIRIGLFNEPLKNKKSEEYSYQNVAECSGNTSSVNCLDVNPLNPQQFCSGSFNGKLNIYNISEKDIRSSENSFQTLKNGKKVKLDKKSIEPIQSQDVHKESISRCLWKTQHEIYTSSFDHTVKLYDTQKVASVHQIGTKDSAVTTFNFRKDMVLSGHEDSYIKQFDFREGNKGPTNIYKSHSLWVSDIQMLPDNEFLFISSSYDHSIKMWDMRSQFPVFTLKSHHDKVFSLAWNGDSKIISGGSDQEIASFSFNQPQTQQIAQQQLQ